MTGFCGDDNELRVL